jgi:hypothetical protein
MIKSKSRAVLLLGAAFLVGGVVGAGTMQLTGDNGERNFRGANSDCVVRHRMLCYWTEKLTLTVDQQEALLVVYRADEEKMDELQRSIRPKVDSVFQTIRPAVDSQRSALRDKVRPHLNEMQRERYDSIVNAYNERRSGDHPRNNGSRASDRSSP